MFKRNAQPAKPVPKLSAADARLMAAVANESRPYTDPQATYPAARDYQRHTAQGAARRGQQ